MKLSEFKSFLNQNPEAELRFVLPDGGLIESHAHITEVGRVDKVFIDCGGTQRRSTYCSLQAWVADDLEHRLQPAKLAAIIEKAGPVLEDADLDVEIEYQDTLISQFPVEAAKIVEGVLLFHLSTKHTDCLAKEVCMVGDASDCCGESGCC